MRHGEGGQEYDRCSTIEKCRDASADSDREVDTDRQTEIGTMTESQTSGHTFRGREGDRMKVKERAGGAVEGLSAILPGKCISSAHKKPGHVQKGKQTPHKKFSPEALGMGYFFKLDVTTSD